MRHLLIFLMVAGSVYFIAAAQDAPAPAAATPTEPPFAPPLLDDQALQELREETLRDLEQYWKSEGPEEAAPNALELTLPQAVQTALRQNPQVLISQSEVDIARAQAGQARAERYPQVGVQGSYVYMEGAESPLGSLGAFSSILGGGLEPSDTFRRDQLSIKQTLYAGGQIASAVRASRFLAESREWQRQAQLNDLEYQTKQAYYDSLLARALIRVAQESVVTFERHLADTQQMFDVGLVSQFEVLRARTEVSARQSNWVAAKNAERLALVNLRRILAVPQDHPLRLASSIEIIPLKESLEDLLAQADQARPELIALNKGISAAGQNVRAAKGRYLPQAAASAEYLNVDKGGMTQPDGWTLALGAQWEVFTGGRRKHQVAEARARESSLVNQRDDLTRLIELDVRQAYIQMQDALAKVMEERATVEFAREGLRLAQLRFQEGVGTQAEILDAELALTGAESSLIRAMRDYAVAHASMEKATGRSWFPDMAAEDTQAGTGDRAGKRETNTPQPPVPAESTATAPNAQEAAPRQAP
ncbi:MAG TPA: TolC family protein [Candidatus Bathyarchaeia archaeon]|nr:TolC family protein [Candidatus Bathyarchaeia archaeon]